MQRSHATPDGATASFMAAGLTPRLTDLDWIGILMFLSFDAPTRDHRQQYWSLLAEHCRLPRATFGRFVLYAIATATDRSSYALQTRGAPATHAYGATTYRRGNACGLLVPRAIRRLDHPSDGVGAAAANDGGSLSW
jgi:hypothetical protein